MIQKTGNIYSEILNKIAESFLHDKIQQHQSLVNRLEKIKSNPDVDLALIENLKQNIKDLEIEITSIIKEEQR